MAVVLTKELRAHIEEHRRRGLPLPPATLEYIRVLVEGPSERYIEHLPLISPKSWNFEVPHIKKIASLLDKQRAREIRHLGLFMPPRHAKTDTLTKRYPVYLLERDPYIRTCTGAHNQELANKFGRAARRLAVGRGIELAKDSTAVASWETVEGGTYRSVGVGAPPMGEGFHLINVDDPYKSRKQAESAVYRAEVSEWVRNDLWTRLEPGGVMNIIHTLWHPEDIGSSIMKEEAIKVKAGKKSAWTFLVLPAEAEENDPLGRKVGEALWPERYDLEALREIHAVLGDYNYNALFQQKPAPREGSFFKVGLMELWEKGVPRELDFCVCIDVAATKDGGDETFAILLAGPCPEGYWYLVDCIHGQWDIGDRDKELRAFADASYRRFMLEPPKERRGRSFRVCYPQDPGAAGKGQARTFSVLFAGYDLRKMIPSVQGKKEIRWYPAAAQVAACNFRIVRGKGAGYVNPDNAPKGWSPADEWEWHYLREQLRTVTGRGNERDDGADAFADGFEVLARADFQGGGDDSYDDWGMA